MTGYFQGIWILLLVNAAEARPLERLEPLHGRGGALQCKTVSSSVLGKLNRNSSLYRSNILLHAARLEDPHLIRQMLPGEHESEVTLNLSHGRGMSNANDVGVKQLIAIRLIDPADGHCRASIQVNAEQEISGSLYRG